MSTIPEKHYWASGMQPEQAQQYLLDLCGSDSQNYTDDPKEVTCERCLAALRAGRGAPGTQPQAGAEGQAPAPGSCAVPANGVLDREVRDAVLKEREDIIQLIKTTMVLSYSFADTLKREPFRQLVEQIRKRP